jgi:hypothetical protein
MISIYKDKSHFTIEYDFSNENKENSKNLFQSLLETKLLPFAFIDNNKLHFHALSVFLLDEYLLKNKNLGIDKCLSLLFSISKQIFYLEQLGYTFYGVGIKDILIINDNTFLILNINTLLPIDNNFCISFYAPFTKPFFISPELLSIETLPSHINYKSIYYSLAGLIIYCLYNINICKGNDIILEEELEIILKSIYGSKLYWCLKRCLNMNVEQRVLLYI